MPQHGHDGLEHVHEELRRSLRVAACRQACFERHRELAREHTERAERAAARATFSTPSLGASFTGAVRPPSGSKALRCAVAQQRLALREYRDASRLRPRDTATRQQLADASSFMRSLEQTLEKPKTGGLRRFLAHYNLSIRYWDLGKAQQAISEAERACKELEKLSLPAGCAEQNRALMERIHAKQRTDQRRLCESVASAPNAVGPNYSLGILYFDKRMLLIADKQLRKARDCARSSSKLLLIEHDREKMQIKALAADGAAPGAALMASTSAASLRGQRQRGRIAGVLEDLEDDLALLAELCSKWCAEEEAGKADDLQETGIRDGSRPQILPCLHRRYEESDPEACAACDRWSAALLAVGADLRKARALC